MVLQIEQGSVPTGFIRALMIAVPFGLAFWTGIGTFVVALTG